MKHIVNANSGKNICIVTHGTAIKAMMCRFLGLGLKEMARIPWVDNTSISVVEAADDGFDVINEGDASHLGSEFSTLQNQEWWEEYLEKVEARKKSGL